MNHHATKEQHMHTKGSRWLLCSILGTGLLLAGAASRGWSVQDKDGKVLELKLDKGKPTKIEGELSKDDKVDAQKRPHKLYAFRGEVGHLYRFTMTSKQEDTLLHLEDTNGKQLKNEDTGGGGTSRLTFLPDKDGTYHLWVGSYVPKGSGSYVLEVTVSEVKPAKIVKLTLEQDKPFQTDSAINNQDGVDQQGRFYKGFEFQAVPKKLYRFTMTSKKLNTHLRVENPAGQVIKYEDGVNQGFATLVFRTDKEGTFRLLTSFQNPNDTGEFHLSAVVMEPREPKIAAVQFAEIKQARYSDILGEKDGLDERGCYTKAYSFKATAGKLYRLDLTGGQFNLTAFLQDANHKALRRVNAGFGNSGRGAYTATKDGELRILVTLNNPASVVGSR